MIRASVVIPAFNAGEFLAASVRSMLDQSLRDIEVLLIDDGSTDGSATSFSATCADPRLRYFRRDNQGLASTLNFGISKSRSEIIIRMDADDIAEPDRVEKQVAYLEARPDIVLLGGQISRVVDGNQVSASGFPTSHGEILRGLLRGEHVICHPSIAFRRSAAMKVGCYWGLGVSEDWDFYLKLAEVGRVANLDSQILRYRFHGSGINAQSMQEVRRNIRLAVINHRNRVAGAPEWTVSDYQARASFRDKLQVAAESNSLRLYRRSLQSRAQGRMVCSSLQLLTAGALWPAQAARRIVGRG
ncbi:glycosyltransferase [Rhodococcus hoagii]|nr:glycosyltransferase [Prescottella equi]